MDMIVNVTKIETIEWGPRKKVVGETVYVTYPGKLLDKTTETSILEYTQERFVFITLNVTSIDPTVGFK